MDRFEMREVSAPIEKINDFDELKSLYDRAFPENERSPIEELINEKSGMLTVSAFYYNDVFCGMAAVLSSSELVHIIYLAVEETVRGQGLGSRALQAIREQNPGRKIVVDVERVEEGAENNGQREKRIAFYLRNDYMETEVSYRWQDEDYVILSAGGIMTDEEWDRFWKEVVARTGRIW